MVLSVYSLLANEEKTVIEADPTLLLDRVVVTGVLDYGDIVDAGDKTELETIEEYQRFGYDVRADWFHLRGNANLPQTSLRLDYSLREDFSGEPSDARMFKGTLAVEPDAASDFSFKLVYGVGEVLTSLKDVDQWKLVIGYKQ